VLATRPDKADVNSRFDRWARQLSTLWERWSAKFAAAGRQVRRVVLALRDELFGRWRRSLQFRTVMATLLLTAIALLGVGAFLSNQIATGLFEERRTQAESEAEKGLTQIKQIFDSTVASDRESTERLVRDTLRLLEGTGADAPRQFLLAPAPDAQNLWMSKFDSGGLSSTLIPEELSRTILENDGQYWQAFSLPSGDRNVPGLAFGTRVNLPPGNDYALYLIYDLSSVQETLDYIHGVMWIAFGILLVLVGGIAWVVARAVVGPVSHAAVVSEKLAAGELRERMEVTGEDEVARLGASFNHMAENLQEQITQLATLSQMQQRFVSDVSHELRTPLTTVRMAAEVLFDARQDFDPVNQRSAELLYHQVERFQALLADLLEISRFDAGAAALDAEPTDIFEVIRHVMDGAQPLADNSGSTMEIVSDLGSCVADMDPRRIDRILRNLLVNALEHGEGKPVEILVACSADAVAVGVRDHGIGMTALEASRVFDRFWRADPARARTTGGSGLGLSIATEDAHLHGGWLQAWGEEGRGTQFRLTLPRRAGDPIGTSPLPLVPLDAEVPVVTS
jgi:two-component system, OmpR family, sensor histidine kinase MtrB